MGRSISFEIEGAVRARVWVAQNRDGTLSFEIGVAGPGSASDLRAVYLDLNRPASGEGVFVYGDAGLTEGARVEAGTDMIGRAATLTRGVVNALGDFDIGISFGPLDPGAGAPPVTGFTLAHATAALTLDMIALADFGLRFVPSDGEADCAGDSGRVNRRPRGGTPRDALEVVELQYANVSPLATDGDGGVLAVIGIPGAADAFGGQGGGWNTDWTHQADPFAGTTAGALPRHPGWSGPAGALRPPG